MLKEISRSDIIDQIYAGGSVYMLVPVNRNTTVYDLGLATRYYIEEPEIMPGPAPDNEGSETIVVPVTTEPLTSKKIDHGKICALWKAGWSIPKIDEEMNCSNQTVYNHLNSEELLKKKEG